MQTKEIRAAEYRRLAGVAQGLADTSLLENVRDKHEQAAARWTALAVLDEQPSTLRPTPA